MDNSTTAGANSSDDQVQNTDEVLNDDQVSNWDDEETSNATDNQTANDGDNLDSSKSTDDTPDDDDKSDEGDKPDDGKESDEGDKSEDTPQFDADLDEWAKTTKRPVPTTDEERAEYQKIRNDARQFHQSKAKDTVKDLNKAIQDTKPESTDNEDDVDPLEKEVKSLQARLDQQEADGLKLEYFIENSVTENHVKAMNEFLAEKVEKAPAAKKQAVFDFWTDPINLEDWHKRSLERVGDGRPDISAVEAEAARKERERIARESEAGGTPRNSRATVPQEPKGYDREAFLRSDED